MEAFDELHNPPGAPRPPEREAELRTIAMPADTNAHGDIFGGWLLAQMDLAAGSLCDPNGHAAEWRRSASRP